MPCGARVFTPSPRLHRNTFNPPREKGCVDYTIKDLPAEERPREKLERVGVANMTDTELLAIVLRTGTQGTNVKELAGDILNTYALPEIAERSMTELEQFDGVSTVKAGQLKAVAELATRLQREDRDRIASLGDVRARIRDMRFRTTEMLRVFHLSAGNELLHEQEVDGVVDGVGFEPRQVFRAAVRHDAAAVILAHNHPSGESSPTDADMRVTRDLVEAGEHVGVTVLDHVIVGEDVTSLREERPDLF